MSQTVEIRVPDLGDVSSIEVIEILVATGDIINFEQPLLTLESDKASMELPSPFAGSVTIVHVAVGDQVAEGTLIVTLSAAPAEAVAPTLAVTENDAGALTTPAAPITQDAAPAPEENSLALESAGVETTQTADLQTQVVVIGAGPGGYTAAFRAADLGKQVILIERYPALGGVCLNVGCIPSKALLHTAQVITAAQGMAAHGVNFGDPSIDLPKLGVWKDSVVAKLTEGLAGLAKQRNVQVLRGTASFSSANALSIEGPEGAISVAFEHAIIAAGSRAVQIPGFPNDDPRIMDSTSALELNDIPARLLVIGGGIIGLEMACVYQALGSKVTVVELLNELIPGCDRDVVRPLAKHIAKRYENIYLGTKVSAVSAHEDELEVHFEGDKAPASDRFDRVLVAVGRRPNGGSIGADLAGVNVDEAGFIRVDQQQRTNVPHIFAIGDICGQPMLAHKATHEGKVAAEVAAGLKSGFDAMSIPSVAYTDPEVAWTGLTEAQAKAQGIEFDKATFPWAASGRALGMGRSEGLTKVLFDKQSGRLLGAAVVGLHAGDLIAEATLAVEMGADAADLALTIHPHPTLSETLNFAAEMVEGTITDLYLPRKK